LVKKYILFRERVAPRAFSRAPFDIQALIKHIIITEYSFLIALIPLREVPKKPEE